MAARSIMRRISLSRRFLTNCFGVAFKNINELNCTFFARILRTKWNSTGSTAALIANRNMELMKDTSWLLVVGYWEVVIGGDRVRLGVWVDSGPFV